MLDGQHVSDPKRADTEAKPGYQPDRTSFLERRIVRVSGSSILSTVLHSYTELNPYYPTEISHPLLRLIREIQHNVNTSHPLPTPSYSMATHPVLTARQPPHPRTPQLPRRPFRHYRGGMASGQWEARSERTNVRSEHVWKV